MEMDSLPNGTAASPGPTLGSGPTAAGPPPSSKLSHLADALKLEHQFLRVPFEHYKKTIRANHRVVEKEMSAVNHLSSLVSRLQGLQRKLEEGSKTEHFPPPSDTAKLLQSTAIKRVRLYGADPAIIKALAGSGITIAIGSSNTTQQ